MPPPLWSVPSKRRRRKAALMWEYRIEKGIDPRWNVHNKEFLDRLNRLGEQGWELIVLDSLGNLFFKRLKQPPAA